MTSALAISSGTIAAIVVIVVIDLFAIFFGLSFARSRRAQRQAQAAETAAILGEPAPPAPKPVSRREFFRRSLVVSLLVFGAEFGGATLAFLWPSLKGGFGSVINAGKLNDILSYIKENDLPFYSGTGRFYIVRYNGRPDGDVDYATEGVAADGIMPCTSVRAPRLPGPVLRAVAVVRVPVPRLEVQHRRRVQARPGAARDGPVQRHGDRVRRRHGRHRS